MTKSTNSGPEFRIEEAIWGHRLHDEQVGAMVAMEFLNVLLDVSFKDYDDITGNKTNLQRTLQYSAYRKVVLRALLFNNAVIESVNKDDYEVWSKWLELFVPESTHESKKKSLRNLIDESLLSGHWDASYLRRAFEHSENENSFEAFSSLIKLIRACAFNANSNKRWTSMFVFPWGKDCLYVDMDVSGTTDRRFFGRSGELLYILLSYADNRFELERLIREKYFDTNNPLNLACKALQGNAREKKFEFKGASGPVRYTATLQHRMNLLCDDLIAILKSKLPPEDLFHHLWRIMGLHLMCYLMERGAEASQPAFYEGQEVDPQKIQDSFMFFCEILAPSSNIIRTTSQRIYQDNRQKSLKTIQVYVEQMYKKALELSGHVDSNDDEESFTKFQDKFFDLLEMTLKKRQEYCNFSDAVKLKEAILKAALARHENHWSEVLAEYGKAIGLASRSGTRRYRYCPTDELIITLMLANVDSEHMLLNEFMAKLYDKYHIVVGQLEKTPLNLNLSESNSALTKNVERLKARLKGLGLLTKLSDGFDVVDNHFFVGS